MGDKGPVVAGREGKTFTGAEALYLAKAWVEQSQKGPDQTESGMWDGIVEHCDLQYGMQRTAGALRVKWQALAREVQHYLGARKAAHNKPRSGSTEVDIEELTMRLYCARAGRKDSNGHDVYALPFKYVEAANFLASHPKFGGRSEADEKRLRDSAMGREESGDGEDTAASGVGRKRPRGVKADKRAVQKARGDAEVADTLREIKEELSKNTAVMRSVAEGQEKSRLHDKNVMLLQVLPPDSEVYRNVLKKVMEDAAAESNATATETAHDEVVASGAGQPSGTAQHAEADSNANDEATG